MPSPTELSEDSLPANLFAVLPDHLKNDTYPNERSSAGKRSLIPLVPFLIIFSIGVGATLAWQSYGARESSYPQPSVLPPQAEGVAQDPPNVIGLAARTASSPDLQQPNATLLDLDAVRQSIDRIATSIASSQGRMTSGADRMAATQEQIRHSVERMATTQEQIAHNVERIAATQEQIARGIDQLRADQEQMSREITKLQEVKQLIRSKNSEPLMRPASASAPKPVSRPSSASAPRPVSPTPTLPEPSVP